jgi:ribosomal protein S18 acetylase RimI-like enzyme
MAMDVRVERVDETVTLDLQQRVLRPHMTLEQVRAERTAWDVMGSECYAAFAADGRMVGCGSVRLEEPPFAADGVGWRIRSMAVEPALRGQGIGAAVLDALLARVAQQGGGTAWCNARTPALGLYRRAGFDPVGEEFEIAEIGPHLAMARTVDGIGSGTEG